MVCLVATHSFKQFWSYHALLELLLNVNSFCHMLLIILECRNWLGSPAFHLNYTIIFHCNIYVVILEINKIKSRDCSQSFHLNLGWCYIQNSPHTRRDNFLGSKSIFRDITAFMGEHDIHVSSHGVYLSSFSSEARIRFVTGMVIIADIAFARRAIIEIVLLTTIPMAEIGQRLLTYILPSQAKAPLNLWIACNWPTQPSRPSQFLTAVNNHALVHESFPYGFQPIVQFTEVTSSTDGLTEAIVGIGASCQRVSPII